MEKREELFKSCTEKLAKELPVLRKMNNLTQQDLGDIIGVSRQTIVNIESGKSAMKWSVFLAILFICSLDYQTSEYLKCINIPYAELKEWLIEKRG
ncbi:MAG: helix-turn-helix domain-containing protein [Oscillospiraceae bacterium]|nr:helix-turn-helix domain-containing protein [Oscillospiraceae bacterium]